MDLSGTKGTFRSKPEVRGTIHMQASNGMDPERGAMEIVALLYLLDCPICASQLR